MLPLHNSLERDAEPALIFTSYTGVNTPSLYKVSPRLLVLMYFTLVSAPLLTATSSHWFLAWMSLEIGVFAIIPVMIGSHHTRATESTTKYFLVQSAGAATLLFAALSNAWLTGE